MNKIDSNTLNTQIYKYDLQICILMTPRTWSKQSALKGTWFTLPSYAPSLDKHLTQNQKYDLKRAQQMRWIYPKISPQVRCTLFAKIATEKDGKWCKKHRPCKVLHLHKQIFAPCSRNLWIPKLGMVCLGSTIWISWGGHPTTTIVKYEALTWPNFATSQNHFKFIGFLFHHCTTPSMHLTFFKIDFPRPPPKFTHILLYKRGIHKHHQLPRMENFKKT